MNDNGQENEFSDELISAYLDGELHGDELDRVSEWLQSSTEAQQTLAELEALRSSLQSLPRNQMDGDFGSRVQRLAEKTMLQSPANVNQKNNIGQESSTDQPMDPVISPRKDPPVTRGDRGWYRGAAWGVAAIAAALAMALFLPEREPTENVAMQNPAAVKDRGDAEPGYQSEEFRTAAVELDGQKSLAKESDVLAGESGAGPPPGENNELRSFSAGARDEVEHDFTEGLGDANANARFAGGRSESSGERLDAAKQRPEPLVRARERAALAGNLAAPSSPAETVASHGSVDDLAAATSPSVDVPMAESAESKVGGGGFAVKLYSSTDQRQEMADEAFADADPLASLQPAGGNGAEENLLAMSNLPGPPDFVVMLDAVSGVDVASELARNLQAQNISLRESPGQTYFRRQGIQDRDEAANRGRELGELVPSDKLKGDPGFPENRAVILDQTNPPSDDVDSDDTAEALTEEPAEEAEEAQSSELKQDLPARRLSDAIAVGGTELIYVEASRSQIEAMLVEMGVQAKPYSGAALPGSAMFGANNNREQLRKTMREGDAETVHPDAGSPGDDYEQEEDSVESELGRAPDIAPVPGIDDKRAALVRVLFVLRTAIPQAGAAALEGAAQPAADITSESSDQ